MKVPFFRPHIGPDEIAEVVHSLENGWLTTGPKVAQFEKNFIEYLGGGVEAVAVNSATAGLHLALEAIGIEHDDEVIVPDYTFTATAEVVRYLGGHPVLVDVDYTTMNVTAAAIEAAITNKTKAIMPVHFAGLPCNMKEIIALAKKYGLKIVEDAAHAIPTFHDGVQVGQLDTDATVFSFYANKTITTGEGGMLVTRDPMVAKRARAMRLHGFNRDAFDRFKTGKWKYDVIAPGYKYNMTDIAGALGIHQLKKAEYFLEERKRVAKRYSEGLKGLPLDLPVDAESGDQHSWHIYIVRLREDADKSRDQVFEELAQKNIMCSVHYTPLHNFTYWKNKYGLSAANFPSADRSGNNAITLPLYVEMPDQEIDYVIGSLTQILSV